ncbi:hypothetical protein LJR029_000465 [Caballeronia sp. LjRoot29]|uniref:hypothetical protein n=1 Tax=Caballeronia sp. LjRoot29 TaxID=3342315 RepID=UPI003ECCD0E2
MKKHLQQSPEDVRDRLTREALASLRAGLRVSHAELRKWAERLNTANPLPLPKTS